MKSIKSEQKKKKENINFVSEIVKLFFNIFDFYFFFKHTYMNYISF